VNRYTGEVREVRDDGILGLQKPAAPPPSMALIKQEIMAQPFALQGMAKYVDGRLLIRITVEPSFGTAVRGDSKVFMDAWRAHVIRARAEVPTPTFNIDLIDGDGFALLGRSVSMNEFAQIVGSDDLTYQLQTQTEVPASPAIANQLKGWEVRWSRNWPAWTPPVEESKVPKT
jgi:hypothetical protein